MLGQAWENCCPVIFSKGMNLQAEHRQQDSISAR
jgi:hypothetical protein